MSLMVSVNNIDLESDEYVIIESEFCFFFSDQSKCP